MEDQAKLNQEEKSTKITRRNLLKSVAIATPALLLSQFTEEIEAAPNGTQPTVLSNLSVVSVSSTNMRVSGRLATISGSGVAGMKVDIFSVAAGSFSKWTTFYTDSSGNFIVTTLKPPVGRKIQIVVDGNGAYSQPFPTFDRP